MRTDPSAAAGGDAPADCPYCGGSDTRREHSRGPSRCRAIYFCRDCRESFEALA